MYVLLLMRAQFDGKKCGLGWFLRHSVTPIGVMRKMRQPYSPIYLTGFGRNYLRVPAIGDSKKLPHCLSAGY